VGIRSYLQEAFSKRLFHNTVAYFEDKVMHQSLKANYYEESLNALQLEIENTNYYRLSQFGSEFHMDRRNLNNIVRLAVWMAIKNPITCRSVNVQADYVFGQGISFVAKHPWVQEVVDEFINYRENRKSLTSHTAMLRAEKRQQVYGSIFFILYTNRQTGRVIVRNLSTLDVTDIICDPDDREKEWYVKCSVSGSDHVTRVVYYPAYGIDEYSGIPVPWVVDPTTNSDHGEILWNAPVLHVAYNKLGHEKFALPEVYPQLDWALAYKRFLEDWTSIIRAFARMAMKITGLSGKKQAGASKSLLQTSTSLSNPIEGNPSPAAASIGLFGKGVDVEPIKTAGSTTPASEGDSVMNMAGCAVGLPNTFFGDAGKGNFATSKTLDRPTELKMISRQKLWNETFTDILNYVVLQAVVAPEGILAAKGASYVEARDVFDGRVIVTPTYPPNDDEQYGDVGQPIDPCVTVHFPELLERNVADRVRSLINAVTAFGKPFTDIIPDKRLVAKLLLQALNVPDAESYIPSFVAMWEENLAGEPGEPVKSYILPMAVPATGGAGAEDASQGGDVGTNG
jgi:hypothetical protein